MIIGLRKSLKELNDEVVKVAGRGCSNATLIGIHLLSKSLIPSAIN